MKNHNNLTFYEQEFWNKNKLCAGIDEAGRGPICGPLVVALVILPINYENNLINDSKKISAKKRELLFKQIINDAIYYRIEVVTSKIIDNLNIYQATKKTMEKLAAFSICDDILVDAIKLEIDKNVISIIKGDSLSISIAAASILAKFYRDQIMEVYHFYYPNYLYNKHKGYPTKKHLELIEIYGINDNYRKSYQPVKKYLK